MKISYFYNMKHLPVVRIFLLAVLLFLVGCADDNSSAPEEDSRFKMELGEFTYGEFKVRTPAYPVFEHVGNGYDILAIGNSPKGRVMRLEKSPCSGADTSLIFRAFCNGVPCEGYPAQTINFYPFEGSYQTLVNAPSNEDYDADKDGRLLVFTAEIDKAGFYKDVQVVAMPQNAELRVEKITCKFPIPKVDVSDTLTVKNAMSSGLMGGLFNENGVF